VFPSLTVLILFLLLFFLLMSSQLRKNVFRVFAELLEEKVIHGYTLAANEDLFSTSSINPLADNIDRVIASSSRIQHVLDQVQAPTAGPGLTTGASVGYLFLFLFRRD